MSKYPYMDMCDVFVCNGCGKKFETYNSINRHKKLVCGKPHHRKWLYNFSMWGKAMWGKAIEEITLNLNMRGKKERKRTVLVTSRKRADYLN